MSETIINLEDEAVRAVTAQPSNAQLLTAIQGVARQVAAVQAAQMLIQQEIKTMSGTLEQQLQALTAQLSAAVQTLSDDLQKITAGMTPGSQITAADIAALETVATAMQTAVMTANAAANPTAPPPAAAP